MAINRMFEIVDDIMICARAFLHYDTSDPSKLARFMRLMDDLTDFGPDEMQIARSAEIASSLYSSSIESILLRLVKLAVMREMAGSADPRRVARLNAAIAELKRETREDADALIALRSMAENLAEPAVLTKSATLSARKRRRSG